MSSGRWQVSRTSNKAISSSSWMWKEDVRCGSLVTEEKYMWRHPWKFVFASSLALDAGETPQKGNLSKRKKGRKSGGRGAQRVSREGTRKSHREGIIPDAGKSQRTSLGAKEKQRCGI